VKVLNRQYVRQDRYEFASRQSSGYAEPFHDLTGDFGERRDLSRAQFETIRGFFDLVLSNGRVP
jgi:hypothetical protein